MTDLRDISTPELLAEIERRIEGLRLPVRRERVLNLLAMLRHDSISNATEQLTRAMAYHKHKGWRRYEDDVEAERLSRMAAGEPQEHD